MLCFLSRFIISVSLLLAILVQLSLWYCSPNNRLHKYLPWLALTVVFAFAVSSFLPQVFIDVVKSADLALTFVLLWEWCWMLPDSGRASGW